MDELSAMVHDDPWQLEPVPPNVTEIPQEKADFSTTLTKLSRNRKTRFPGSFVFRGFGH
jgi:hypothetical protein